MRSGSLATTDPNKLSREITAQALSRHSDTLGNPYGEDGFRAVLLRTMDAQTIVMGSVLNMMEEIADDGMRVPYEALGQMRDEAISRAVTSGVEYLWMQDTDALPEPDTMTRLMGLELPIVAPVIIDGTGLSFSGPRYEPGQGVMKVRWCPYTGILIQTSLFSALPGLRVMGDARGEGVFFLRLWSVAQQMLVDTNNELKIASSPMNNEQHTSLASYNRAMAKAWERRLQPIDRVSEV